MFNKKYKIEFPIHTILRLSKELGAKRMSKSAAKILSDHFTKELSNIINQANTFSKHADRKTIMNEDILLAIKKDN